MSKIPWWGWVIVLLILIGLFPGLWHQILGLLSSGANTVCNGCTGHG